MKKLYVLTALVAICGSLLMPNLGFAQQKGEEDDPFVPSGGGVAIPDNAYDGTIGSMACVTTTVPAGPVAAIDVDITLEHTWVGDLTIKLVSPSLEELTLMSRPGYAEAADDGSGCCGDSSNLIQTSPLNFADGNPYDAETMGATIPSGDFVCQDDGECDFFANPDTGPGTNFAQFIGQPGGGDWQICVGDGAGGDTGSIIAATANVTTGVPTVNTVGLVALLALLAGGSLFVMRRKTLVH